MSAMAAAKPAMKWRNGENGAKSAMASMASAKISIHERNQ
jgi:hypothetical protein